MRKKAGMVEKLDLYFGILMCSIAVFSAALTVLCLYTDPTNFWALSNILSMALNGFLGIRALRQHFQNSRARKLVEHQAKILIANGYKLADSVFYLWNDSRDVYCGETHKAWEEYLKKNPLAEISDLIKEAEVTK